MTDALAQTAPRCATPLRSLRSGWLTALLETRKTRRALAKLSAEQLCDIGLTQEQARTESRRTTWDVPTYWRK